MFCRRDVASAYIGRYIKMCHKHYRWDFLINIRWYLYIYILVIRTADFSYLFEVHIPNQRLNFLSHPMLTFGNRKDIYVGRVNTLAVNFGKINEYLFNQRFISGHIRGYDSRLCLQSACKR